MMFVLLTQAHMVWTFINYHFTKMRERKAQQHANNVYITNNDLQKRKEKQQKKGNLYVVKCAFLLPSGLLSVMSIFSQARGCKRISEPQQQWRQAKEAKGTVVPALAA